MATICGTEWKRVLRLMQSLARNVATYVDNKTLAADTAGATGGPLDRDTVGDYLRALERIFVIEDQPAWAPHLRSKWQLRTSPKRHFTDPAMALAALRISPERALREPLQGQPRPRSRRRRPSGRRAMGCLRDQARHRIG